MCTSLQFLLLTLWFIDSLKEQFKRFSEQFHLFQMGCWLQSYINLFRSLQFLGSGLCYPVTCTEAKVSPTMLPTHVVWVRHFKYLVKTKTFIYFLWELRHLVLSYCISKSKQAFQLISTINIVCQHCSTTTHWGNWFKCCPLDPKLIIVLSFDCYNI